MSLAAPAPYPDALAPLRLPKDQRLSPEQLGAVCSTNPQAVVILTAEGHLIHLTPTGGETGARNSRLLIRLLAWADSVGCWQVFDNSTGFLLPDGSVRSPDASLVDLERWRALTPSSAAGSRHSVPICWSNSPAQTAKDPAASRPCGASWPPIRRMVPGWAGC